MSNTDLVVRTPRLPVAGETMAGLSFQEFAGGKGANQAVAAARSGADVWFGGAVGDDAYGTARLQDLRDAGVDVSLVQICDDMQSGIAFIMVDEGGDNQIVTVSGANDEVNAAALTAGIEPLDADLLLLTWELPVPVSLTVLERLPRTLQIVLTTAPYHASVLETLPDNRLTLVANRVEAAQMLGARVEVDRAEEAAIAVRNLGVEAAVITLGNVGAAWADRTQSGIVHAPSVQVVDSTGAGDAFSGTLASWLAAGSSFENAVTAGVHAGSIAVTRAGAQRSLPSREQILESLAHRED